MVEPFGTEPQSWQWGRAMTIERKVGMGIAGQPSGGLRLMWQMCLVRFLYTAVIVQYVKTLSMG